MPKQLSELLTPGVTVEVTDPRHPQSKHTATFLGRVCYCHQNHVLVMDTEEHTYDVFMDEILCLMNYKNSSSCYYLRINEYSYDVVCILPTGIVETIANALDKTTALYVIELLSTSGNHQQLAA